MYLCAVEHIQGPVIHLITADTGNAEPWITRIGKILLKTDGFSENQYRQVLLLLRYLAAEHDTPGSGDEKLFEILHFDLFGIAPMDIARLAADVADRQFGEQRTSIRRLLLERASQPARDLFDTGLPEGMKKASALLEKLISDVALRPEQLSPLIDTLIIRIDQPDKGAGPKEASPQKNGPQEATPQAPQIMAAEEAFVSRRLEKFVMNATALNNYLRCPLEFYYRNVIRVPSHGNEATAFGSAVHHALQRLFEQMKEHPAEKFPDKEELLEEFRVYMSGHREGFTREAFDRRLAYGFDVLGDYYDRYLSRWHRIVAVERNIRHVLVRGVPLKGKLDKLEFQGKEVNIVDYKTGNIDKAMRRLTPPNNETPNGGDYWRQAVFYKILVDNYGQKDWKAVSMEFDFIEPDGNKEYRKEKLVIRPEDITTVTHQIVDTWQKIGNREFYTGCGKPDCHWCNFVKTNNLAI